MHVIRRHGWEIPEHQATPEHLFWDRRAFLAATGAAAVALSPAAALAQRASDVPDPTKDLYPAKRNEKYKLDRPVTEESINTTYNNFYEFGSSKSISREAQKLKLRPWSIKIDGMVEKPQEVAIDDLVRKMPLEERLYRHRCVEAWGMAIPWTGFPLAKLVEMARPLSSAKYVEMHTFLDPVDGDRAARELVSLALYGRRDHGGGEQRPRLPRHRRLWQAGGEVPGRAAAPGAAVEIRLQVDQIDHQVHLHRQAAEDVLGSPPGLRIRLLGQRQSGGRRIRAGARPPSR